MINQTAKKILKALSFDGVEVEAFRHMADLKRLDPMKIFYKKVDEKIYNGSHAVPIRIFFPSEKSFRESEEKKHDIQDKKLLLFIHGGGWVTESIDNYERICARLASATDHIVVSVEYRLAPEHPYPAAVEDAMRAWDYLMYQGYGAENVTVAGDSAGGNLALVLCRRLKAAGRRMPRALLLMSPWTDMTMSGASYRERVESDPMLTPEYIEAVRRAYAGDRDLQDPDLSPLLGDLGSFPPTLIQVGDHEILYSDSASLAAALRAAHVPCRLEVSEGMWHVFQMFPIKKAAAAMESAARFLLEL